MAKATTGIKASDIKFSRYRFDVVVIGAGGAVGQVLTRDQAADGDLRAAQSGAAVVGFAGRERNCFGRDRGCAG